MIQQPYPESIGEMGMPAYWLRPREERREMRGKRERRKERSTHRCFGEGFVVSGCHDPTLLPNTCDTAQVHSSFGAPKAVTFIPLALFVSLHHQHNMPTLSMN
ncbi:MAG: hypothetical protein FRX48_05486 [Lasallia pustulata]|uniref:Uncharacterized protein n=1 Tax=Lasallia pustulata TaxID=136370 RepID=A0A5M8PQF9_9LECA|nr:MAG: hypothetical protein FRX48_05486 [Lasallia pustulata]